MKTALSILATAMFLAAFSFSTAGASAPPASGALKAVQVEAAQPEYAETGEEAPSTEEQPACRLHKRMMDEADSREPDMRGAGECGCGCGMNGCRGRGNGCGQGCEHSKGMGGPGRMDGISWPGMETSCRTPEFFLMRRDVFNLSDNQLDSMKKLLINMKKEATLKGAGVKVLEMELSEIVTGVDFKADDAVAKLKDIEKARTELRTIVIKASAAARDLLGPEQIERLKEMDRDMVPAGHDAMPGGMPSKMKRMMMDRMKRN